MNQSSFQPPIDCDGLRERLEAAVYMVLSFRRDVDEPAERLAGLSRDRQERFLAAVEYISIQTAELAYNFCMFGIDGLEMLRADEWEEWVRSVLDTYDRAGVLGAIGAMQKVQAFAEAMREARSGVVHFSDVNRVLGSFVTALSGRPLKLASADEPYTDTETVYLPDALGRFADPALNASLYKAMAAQLWAQTWFGTWRRPLSARLHSYENPDRALALFEALECMRLDACIARELPGLHRELLRLREADGGQAPSAEWRTVAERLQQAEADAEDSLRLLGGLYDHATVPARVCYQARVMPQLAEAVIEHRKLRDRRRLQELLADLQLELERPGNARQPLEPRSGFQARKIEAPELPAGFRLELRFAGEPVAPLQDVEQVLESVVQDLGEIPADYLVPAGHGRYRASGGGARTGGIGVPGATDRLYDEWDFQRQRYRKDFCLLKQRDVHPMHDDFVGRTLEKYRGLLKHLYRTFEALRGEDRRLRRQPQGDAVDIDAVVESYGDQRAGLEWHSNLFVERKRVDRDIAVMFLVDMSGSTKGWINDLERESLVLLCEALEILGDRYAIYGFSGFTHKRCELLRIKHMQEPYVDEVRARISGIKPGDYTRLGVFIRHLTREFQDIEARTKLLITLSDGRPDDQDGYRGTYGIEDTRQALFEARYQGIHPYCITIDDEALEYLPHMYGPANFTVINEVHKLPYKVSDIYRRITR